MIAKDSTKYALIENGEVTQIFTSAQLREWDENTILAVEIPENKEVTIGTRYEEALGMFLEKSLQELKEDLKDKITFFYEREVGYMQGETPQSEANTFERQRQEAQELKNNPNAETPLLLELAKQRGEDKQALAEKILNKNAKYTQRLAKLLGYKQSLIKQVENAENAEALQAIKYISPLTNE